MSPPEITRSSGGEHGIEDGEPAGWASPRLWVLLVAGVLLPPLVAFGLVSAFGSAEKGTGIRAKSELPVGGKEPAEQSEAWEEAPDPSQAPGELLSDLGEAFREGETSGLVLLETPSEQGLFETLRNARGAAGGVSGLAFFRIQTRPDGTELYDVQDQAGQSQGVVHLRRIEDRWRVTGMGKAGESR